MTTQSSTEPPASQGAHESDTAGDDQQRQLFGYGHGRMPFFMKLVWLGFLAFGAWYVVRYLLGALGKDLAAG